MKSMSLVMDLRMYAGAWPFFSLVISAFMKGWYCSHVTSVLPIQNGESVTCRVSLLSVPCQVNEPALMGSISSEAPESSLSV